jgi:hypothetical protein
MTSESTGAARWRSVLAAAPSGFAPPDSFREVVLGGLPQISPLIWLVEVDGLLEGWSSVLSEQYPGRRLVPFAKNSLTDDVFCWDIWERHDDPTVHMIHTFTDAGWEERGHWQDFDEWLSDALSVHRRWDGRDDAFDA